MACVLIVEDEEQVRVLAESILQEHGHATLSASNYDEAITLLKGEQKVELLFTDLRFNDDHQGGIRLAQEAMTILPGLPVLYTTGQGVTDGMKAMFVERYGFLAKPYTADQLSIAVENLLN
jgi:DNA-binding NtrC family response regulator